jgi:hypothetical protein
MTEERLVLAELLEKAGEGDFLRAVAEAVLQLLMETDVEGLIGAGRYERSGERTTWRNGYRDRTLDTRLGSLQLRQSLPSRKRGQLLPAVSGSPQSSEKALIAVACRPAGWTIWCRRWAVGDSKSQVSKLCKSLPPRRRGRSTSGFTRSSNGCSPASGRIYGSTPPT